MAEAMLDAFTTAELQVLRVRLQDFGSRQSDRTVQGRCHALDLSLARMVACQDDQVLRELAMSVEQLTVALQSRRLDRGAHEAAMASSAFLSDARPDPVPVAVEPHGPRLQWFAVDLERVIPPSLAL
jgi:hypothetical protein